MSVLLTQVFSGSSWTAVLKKVYASEKLLMHMADKPLEKNSLKFNIRNEVFLSEGMLLKILLSCFGLKMSDSLSLQQCSINKLYYS